MVERFQSRYGSFLRTFDGFVVTHTPAFAQLFQGLGKPTLVVASTRYEAPYTADPAAWHRLDGFLARGVASGRLMIVANNRADADYMQRLNGLQLDVVPSVCDKPEGIWSGNTSRRVVLARAPGVAEAISEATRGEFEPISVLGKPFHWTDLLDCAEVFVIPQNVSTMMLFELATAGVPVAVPGREWLKQMAEGTERALSELTYYQIAGIDPSNLAVHSPLNWRSPTYLDWWIDRADFSDRQLMPNVRIVNDKEELIRTPQALRESRETYLYRVRERNAQVKQGRSRLAASFLARVREGDPFRQSP